METPKKNGRGKEWADSFPESTEKMSDSMLFMNRCLYLTFSHILQSRGLMPAETFKKRSIGTLVKSYTMDIAHPLGLRMSNKFRGAGEAMQLGYLKEFMIVVSNNEEDADDAIEVFTWKMVYGHDGSCAAHFTDGDKNVFATLAYRGEDMVKEQTRALLVLTRKLCRQILAPLPETAYATLRIRYTDETPKGYQAPGFYHSDTCYDLSPEAKTAYVGGIATGHHRCLLTCESVCVEDEYTVHQMLQETDSFSDASLNASFTDTAITASVKKVVLEEEDSGKNSSGVDGSSDAPSSKTDSSSGVTSSKSSSQTESGDDSRVVNRGSPAALVESSSSSVEERRPRRAPKRKLAKAAAQPRGRPAKVVRPPTPGRSHKLNELTPGTSPSQNRRG